MTTLTLIASLIMQYFDGDGDDLKLLLTSGGVVASIYAMVGGVKSIVHLYVGIRKNIVQKESLEYNQGRFNITSLIRVIIEIAMFFWLVICPPYMLASLRSYYKPEIIWFVTVCTIIALFNDIAGRHIRRSSEL